MTFFVHLELRLARSPLKPEAYSTQEIEAFRRISPVELVAFIQQVVGAGIDGDILENLITAAQIQVVDRSCFPVTFAFTGDKLMADADGYRGYWPDVYPGIGLKCRFKIQLVFIEFGIPAMENTCHIEGQEVFIRIADFSSCIDIVVIILHEVVILCFCIFRVGFVENRIEVVFQSLITSINV